jgi:parallel beta-helix repeat protein
MVMVRRSLLLGLGLFVLSSILPAGAAATHVACGDVITQDTTLDSDLLDCPGDGVVIGASGVRLDLGGHTIDGTGVAAGNQGVENNGADDVEVRNGRITGFQAGVSIRLGGSNLLTGLFIADTGHGVFLEEASSILVEQNVIRSSGAGVIIQREGSFNVVRGNSITGVDTGVALIGFGTFEILSHMDIVENDLSRNDTGMVSTNTLEMRVAGNRVSGNVEGGIVDSQSTFARFEDNVTSGNGFSGISTSNSTQVEVVGNRSWSNGVDGIVFLHDVRGATVADNFARDNGDDGIDVDRPSSSTATVTIARNRAHHNGDLGIEAVPNVTDGGGNKAHGNGNPLQCLNVSCK